MAKRFTDKEIIAALKATLGMVYTAARMVGCSHETIYARGRESKAVAAVMHTTRGEIIDEAELTLIQAMRAKEPWAVKMILNCLARNRGYVADGVLNDLQQEIARLREQLKQYTEAQAKGK